MDARAPFPHRITPYQVAQWYLGVPLIGFVCLGFGIQFFTDSAGKPSTANLMAEGNAQSKLVSEMNPAPNSEALPAPAADVEKPAKQDKAAKKDDPIKNDSTKSIPAAKLPPRKGDLKDLETDKGAAEKKLLRQPHVTAEVRAVIGNKKSLRLKLTIPYVKINERQVQNYYNAQMSLMQARNAQGVVNAQNRMAQAAAQFYLLDKIYKEVEWTATDELKVRVANPPPQFDDRGRLKRYTKKELQELKGNDKLPGFPAEFSDIKAGQIVQVTLLQNKNGSRLVKRSKDAEGESSADNLPRISMIIILADPKN
jgi:hypothetical protein